MSYFDEIYMKRLNRYGNDYQTRVQNQRERAFEDYLLKSVYRVDFEYQDDMVPAILEPHRQDETKTIQYLLTRVNINIPNGMVLMIEDKDFIKTPWMIYYLENIKASGYNRYVVLKMTHLLKWNNNKEKYESWAYMFGPRSAAIRDTIKSSGNSSLYLEATKENFFIMPRNKNISKTTYFEITQDDFVEGYVVTGYDIQSTPGVEYVTIDPVPLKNKDPDPIKTPTDSAENFYWLGGN